MGGLDGNPEQQQQGPAERPALALLVLTEAWAFDTMHRRRVGCRRRKEGPYGHSDAHKYCPLGRCGTRPGTHHERANKTLPTRSAKITAWRIAKAMKNRMYLEEEVYGKHTK